MQLRRFIVRLLHLLARPVRRGQGGHGIIIQPYRGYGTRREIYLMGRIFRQPGTGSAAPQGRIAADLVNILRRLLRWGAEEQALEVSFAGQRTRTTTDRDGYFKVRLKASEEFPVAGPFHPAELSLAEDRAVQARGEVLLPSPNTRFAVISDIDDTVVYTGVANKLKMMWRLFMQGADSRVAFPGVAAFYRALHQGVGGDEANPMLYVSRGPWSIYEMLEAFFERHRIPIGPVLFLRDWGLTLQHPLPRRAQAHKKDLIEDMLEIYRQLPLVLIGDSGQHDPEIYADIVRRHRGRIAAVYIRNVSKDAARHGEIEDLARQVEKADSSLLLASDSLAMARHAAEHGLIAESALDSVAAEQDPRAPAPRRKTDAGHVERALDEDSGPPPTVEVEGDSRRDG